MSWEAEYILRRLRDGSISEYEAKDRLELEYGSCSCMERSIDETIRDVRWGHDEWSGRRKLDDAHDRCERDEQDRRDQEEQEEQRQHEQRMDERRRRQVEEEEYYQDVQTEQLSPDAQPDDQLPF